MLTVDDSPLDPDAVARDMERVTAAEYFAFRLADRIYALPGMSVERVVLAQRIVPVPTTPRFVRGVIHLAGRIVAVIDLAKLLGLDVARDGERIVLIGVRSFVFGIVVDNALGMWAVSDDRVTDHDDDPLVRGSIACSAGVAAVLDHDALLAAILGERGHA